MNTVVSLPTLDELRRYVHAALCERDSLDPAQSPLRESLILSGGRPCGLLLEVRGPRLTRNSAIWAAQENRILFYDTSGARVGEVRLCEAPDPAELLRSRDAA
jgi:hypothetical protein